MHSLNIPMEMSEITISIIFIIVSQHEKMYALFRTSIVLATSLELVENRHFRELYFSDSIFHIVSV